MAPIEYGDAAMRLDPTLNLTRSCVSYLGRFLNRDPVGGVHAVVAIHGASAQKSRRLFRGRVARRRAISIGQGVILRNRHSAEITRRAKRGCNFSGI